MELLLGIAIGPQGLALVGPQDGALPGLATLGMAFLFFAAGMEIDLPAIRGRPARRALAGWLGSLLVGAGVAFIFRAAGLVDAWQVVAIALSTTALGVLVPMLLDSGVLKSPLGRYFLATDVEMLPILLMSLSLARHRVRDIAPRAPLQPRYRHGVHSPQVHATHQSGAVCGDRNAPLARCQRIDQPPREAGLERGGRLARALAVAA